MSNHFRQDTNRANERLFISQEERGSAAETVTMRAVAQRATLTPILTPIPTAPINRRRTKTWKTRMMTKRKVKFGHLFGCDRVLVM